MTLWQLERIRLVRTHRWMILFGVYVLFGTLGALTARYINEILERFGEGMTVVAPDPRPLDGIVQFVSNAGQLVLLALVMAAASASSLDSKPEVAPYVRTKTSRPGRLVVAPFVVTAVVAAAALAAGTGITWVLTTALIGPLSAGPIILGTGYGALYLALVVSVVAGFTRSQVATVFAAVGVLLVFPIAGTIAPIKPWLPSELLTAVAPLVEGAPWAEFARSIVMAVVATVGLLALAVHRFDQREV